MKSKLLVTIIGAAGLAGLAVSSYGQGSVLFNNYVCLPSYPVIYGSTCGALAGRLAGANVSVELGYALGTNFYQPVNSSPDSRFTLIPASITAVNADTPGYFEGPMAIIPNYTPGPITFEILAWTTDGGTSFANSGTNAVIEWIEPLISTLPAPPATFTALPHDIILDVVPEPCTLALAGLGALILLVEFRRKQ